MPLRRDEKSGKAGRKFPDFFNFAGKRVKISIREGYSCIQNDYDWHGNTIKC